MDDRPRLNLKDRAEAVLAAWDWLASGSSRGDGTPTENGALFVDDCRNDCLDLAGLYQAVELLRREVENQPRTGA